MATLEQARVGRYRLLEVAGRGGMGVVYRAHDDELERVVALKLIAPELARDAAFRARFVRESRLTAALDHPNVIPVFQAGEDGGRLFIAMRFVDGTDLGRLLHERGAAAPARAADLVAQAAAALDAAHARGLVHRDVKPANLLVAEEERRPHVYLTDFGLAKRDGSSAGVTTSGHWLGTPDYSSPEQIEGRDLDPRSDVYSLGCVLFAALTGRAPFGDVPRMRKAGAHVHDSPPALRDVDSSVPAAFEPVVARALAKDPAERFESAGELGEAALAAAAGAAPATRSTRRLRRRRAEAPSAPTVRVTAPQRPRRRLAGLAALAAVLVAVAAAVAALTGAFDGSRRAPTPAPAVARAPAAPPTAGGDAGTVRCSAASCTQAGRRVQAPIDSGRCSVQGRAGTWIRIDTGSPPLLACAPASAPPGGAAAAASLPDLTGARLDHAQSLLGRLGIANDTSGGGVLGIVDSSNWTVCATQPAAGTRLAPGGRVKLFVDRGC